jgi:transposase-like protein
LCNWCSSRESGEHLETKTKREAALAELLAGKSTEEIVGPDGLLQQLMKSLWERAMNAELRHHLGYSKHEPEGRGSGNSRNGQSRKPGQGDCGKVEIAVPRDPNGSFEPKIRPQHERRLAGLADKVLAM